MSKSMLVVLCAAIAVALMFVMLRSERTRGAVAVLPAPQPLESAVADAPTDVSEPEERREEPAPSAPEPTPATPPVASETLPEPAEPAEGSADAVLKMLEDPVFVDACARLSETDAQTLIDLEDRGQKVLSAYQAEECQRRVEAGLYERMEGYVPGEPFTTSSSKDEVVSYSISDGEARRIEFTPEEYPHMHKLRTQIRAFRRERSSRDRAAR